MSNEAKLEELRARTDRELLILIRRELDRTLAVADVAATKGSPLHVQAEEAYETVMTLLPKVTGLSSDERRELNIRLKELRVALDRLPAEIVQWYTA